MKKADIARLNCVTGTIIGAAIEVHRHLGPGLLESTYEGCLLYELEQLGLEVERQVGLPVVTKGMRLDQAHRVDVRVEGTVVVEIKSVPQLLPVHEAQVLSYLKRSGCMIGLLLNFNVVRLKDGIRRFKMGY